MEHQDRYVRAETNTGWGVAAAVIALTILCIVAVRIIHVRTWRNPTDVTWHTKGDTIRGH
jgi:hypothetical protein